MQTRSAPEAATLIGSGKVEELRTAVKADDIDVVVFDQDLSPTQQRNLEKTLETKVIVPAARTHLTSEDWAEIGAAFASNGDPRFSVDNDEEFRQLFVRIMNLAQAQVAGARDAS